MKKTILLIAPVFFIVNLGFSASQGTSGAQFLKIVSAARLAGLSGTSTALSGDIETIAANPAGLGSMQKRQVTLNQNSWIDGISSQFVAVGLPFRKIGVLGLSVIMLNVAEITKTNDLGAAEGTYKAADLAVSLAYAKKFSKRISAGLNVKMINSKIEDESASAYAVDIGGIYQALNKLALGLVIQNLGAKIKFIDQGDPLPATIKLGSLYNISRNFKAGLDLTCPNDSDLYLSVGSEYYLISTEKIAFPLRIGYRTGKQTGGLSGLGTGFGIIYNNLLGLDFAWTPVGDLGNSLQFGLRFVF